MYYVIDTEGKEKITEIAIVDEKGKLIYEKFIKNDEDLKEIYQKLNNQTLIAHFAKHDEEILKKSFEYIGLEFKANFICTYELAKNIIDVESYSLEVLSKHFNFRLNNKFFDGNLAHRASYDAIFTYKLYNKLIDIQKTLNNAKKYNPFSSSKVDNPFQEHFDDLDIYKNEFSYLINILNEVKQDKNNQSKSVVVLGEAGSGKSHLMMRFVKTTSKTNRFLFIRQPNNYKDIIFHIYLRILESFIKKINNSDYSQLEYLLAKSISQIIIQNYKNPTQKQQQIIKILKENHLNLYTKFNNAKNWQIIKKFILSWWEKNYSSNEITINLLNGFIKYAQYKDKYKKNLVVKYLSGYELDSEELEKIGLNDWVEFSKDEFALEAISLLGKLSIFDEPMVLCFDQLESLINDDRLLANFGEALKEIITQTPNSLVIINLFPNRWKYFTEFFDSSVVDRMGNDIISLPKLSSKEIKNLLKKRAKFYQINLDYIFTQKDYQKATSHSSIRSNINQANYIFKHKIYGMPLIDVFDDSCEVAIKNLTKRVEYLEKLLKINNPTQTIKNDTITEYIQQVYNQKFQEYDKELQAIDSDEKGKLNTIFLSIKDIYGIDINFFKFRRVLPEHLILQKGDLKYCVGFLNMNGKSFSSRIQNCISLMNSNKDILFRIFRDVRNPLKPSSKKFIQEFEKKGKFILVDKQNQVIFNTLYQIIEDYNNKDINFEIEAVVENFITKFNDFWICRFLK